MDVKVKKLDPNAIIPFYAHPGEDAGLDLTATSYSFENGRHIFSTGLAFEIPKGYVGLLFPRSSINKYDLRLTNCVGVLDSGFRGEVKFVFENDGMISRDLAIYKVGDKIGQILILSYRQIAFVEVNELSSSVRSEKGFGSSGS